MLIALDLDDVLVNNTVIFDTFVENNIKEKFFNPTDWYMNCYKNILLKDGVCIVDKIFDNFKNYEKMNKAKPIIGVYEKLKEWKNKNYKMFVLTSRYCREETISYVKELFGDYVYDIFNTNGCFDYKFDCLNAFGVDVFIDDCPLIMEKVKKESKTKPILISNEETPFNYYLRGDIDYYKTLNDIIL